MMKASFAVNVRTQSVDACCQSSNKGSHRFWGGGCVLPNAPSLSPPTPTSPPTPPAAKAGRRFVLSQSRDVTVDMTGREADDAVEKWREEGAARAPFVAVFEPPRAEVVTVTFDTTFSWRDKCSWSCCSAVMLIVPPRYPHPAGASPDLAVTIFVCAT